MVHLLALIQGNLKGSETKVVINKNWNVPDCFYDKINVYFILLAYLIHLTSAFLHVLILRSILRKVFISQLTPHIKIKKWVDWTTILHFWKYGSRNLLSKYNVKCILLSENLKIYTFFLYMCT